MPLVITFTSNNVCQQWATFLQEIPIAIQIHRSSSYRSIDASMSDFRLLAWKNRNVLQKKLIQHLCYCTADVGVPATCTVENVRICNSSLYFAGYVSQGNGWFIKGSRIRENIFFSFINHKVSTISTFGLRR
jgi:hypothetical protein